MTNYRQEFFNPLITFTNAYSHLGLRGIRIGRNCQGIELPNMTNLIPYSIPQSLSPSHPASLSHPWTVGGCSHVSSLSPSLHPPCDPIVLCLTSVPWPVLPVTLHDLVQKPQISEINDLIENNPSWFIFIPLEKEVKIVMWNEMKQIRVLRFVALSQWMKLDVLCCVGVLRGVIQAASRPLATLFHDVLCWWLLSHLLLSEDSCVVLCCVVLHCLTRY